MPTGSQSPLVRCGGATAWAFALILAAPMAVSVWADVDSADPASCTTYARPTHVGQVPDSLEEMSGLAPSRIHDGIYWAHNDSGNAFELFGIDATGKIRARFRLLGAEPRDIEDIAVGPCSEGAKASCVYLGDIGDNLYRRPNGQIYRLREPDSLGDGERDVEVLRFSWPLKPRNAEAMVVDQRTGAVFVWTKEPRSLGIVHRLDDLSPTGVGRAVPIKQIHPPDSSAGLPTGADTHRGGERILIRTYNQVWELRREGATGVEDVLEAEPIRVPGRMQRQAEAISYTHDGRGYVLGTESAGSPIYAVGCAETPAGNSSSSS